jgi:hypothetical protein
MREILSSEMDAFIVLVDASDPPSFPEAADLIEQFENILPVPYLVVANKMDLDNTANLAQVRRGTQAGPNITVMPCVATQKSSVRQVLLQMIELLKRESAAS